MKQSIELMFGEMCSVTIEGEGSGGDVVEHDVRSPASHQVEPGTYEEEVKEVQLFHLMVRACRCLCA